MKKVIVFCGCLLLCSILDAQRTEYLMDSYFYEVKIHHNSLLSRLIDTIIRDDSACLRTGSDLISILCSEQKSETDTTYYLLVDDGICFVDITDTLLVGISLHRNKRILWYNTIPCNLGCYKANNKIFQQTRTNCPINELIPRTYCLYYYGILSIIRRENCELLDEYYSMPIIIN